MANEGNGVNGVSTATTDRISGLLRRVAVGDRAAFSELYDLTAAYLYDALPGSPDEPASRDVALQETFLSLWQVADDFDADHDDAPTWLLDLVQPHIGDGRLTSERVERAVSPLPEVKDALLAQLDLRIRAGMTPSALRAPDAAPAVAAVMPVTVADPPAAPPAPRAPAAPPLPPELAAADTNFDETFTPAKRRPRIGTRIVAALAITALVAGVGAGLFGVLQPPAPENVQTIERITQAPDVQFASTSVASGGQAGLTWSVSEARSVLVAKGLNAAPTGHTYKVWFVRDNTHVAAGTFKPNDAGEAAVLISGDMREGDIVTVTVEPVGGSADGTPSDEPVLSIPTGPAVNSA